MRNPNPDNLKDGETVTCPFCGKKHKVVINEEGIPLLPECKAVGLNPTEKMKGM